jgi:hypothetical protein
LKILFLLAWTKFIAKAEDDPLSFSLLNNYFKFMLYSPSRRQVYLREITKGDTSGEFGAIDGAKDANTLPSLTPASLPVKTLNPRRNPIHHI